MADKFEKNSESGMTNFGAWTLDGFEKMISRSAQIRLTGRKIDYISRQFLGVAYREKTLVGDEKTPEKFVADLSGVDCFTYIDYVEACRRSDSFLSFKNNLVRVRYRSGIVTYDHRNHFFTDWIDAQRGFIEDATQQIGGRYALFSRKLLNRKGDETVFLPGIEPVERMVCYIPAHDINDSMLRKCKSGDYIGVYTNCHGLDVSHVGIFVRNKGRVNLRHASSAYRKVIDQEFTGYMRDKPGFLVLRPRNNKELEKL